VGTISQLILVTGAGGFKVVQLVKYLERKGAQIRAVDRKPFDGWYFCSSSAENRVCDLQNLESRYQVPRGVDEVSNLVADMGGMGFIENNKALYMLPVLINTIF
jgi:nucleoside-diphosphate-sugar epimerase